ncbi:WD40 repeat-like protein [Coniochaeta ligniaria NRRL 30616]|uniref:WD40 repeat-like protein n=1 Tax=Coniochaeta ligniaria NRRL 30616 TaxID=1408157 RepID=A0A1J7IR27_9PEZI|nr:WD40 repeat-like protein [Coniochaeta ligniaria NRRL 30616]
MSFPDKPIAQLLGATGPIHAVTYSASPGTYILTGSSDRSVRLYNPSSLSPPPPTPQSSSITAKPPSSPQIPQGRLIQTYSAHGHEVLSLAVSADNARFVSAGGDRAAFLWDVATAQTIRRFAGTGTTGHAGRINAVSFGGLGDSLVVTAGFDTTVRVWDVRSGGSGGAKPVQVLAEARDSVAALVVRGPEIVAGSVDGRVRGYDVRMGRVVTDVLGASVTSLCLSRDGKTVLVGTLDSKMRLMDRENGACLKTYGDAGWRNEEFRVQSVLGGGERYVVAGDELTAGSDGDVDGRVWAWDLLTGKMVARVRVPWGPGGMESRKRVLGRDGKEKERKNVVSCIDWKEGGYGDQFCVGGTSGVVTVFGTG